MATMTDCARYSVPRAQSRNGRSEKSTRSMSTSTIWRPEALGLGAHGGHQVRALDPVGEAGVVLDITGQHQLAARLGTGDDHWLQVGPRRIDRSRESGRAGSDDDDLGIDPTHPER